VDAAAILVALDEVASAVVGAAEATVVVAAEGAVAGAALKRRRSGSR
jgi:hypothetical protein